MFQVHIFKPTYYKENRVSHVVLIIVPWFKYKLHTRG